jgi:dGTPase
MVRGLIEGSQNGIVSMPENVLKAFDLLHNFMFDNVYTNPKAKSEEVKAIDLVCRLFEYYSKEPHLLPAEFSHILEEEGAQRAACDYIAGMTDNYALYIFEELYMPKSWNLRT